MAYEAASTLAMILALLPLAAAISGSGDQLLQPLAIALIAGIAVLLPLVWLDRNQTYDPGVRQFAPRVWLGPLLLGDANRRISQGSIGPGFYGRPSVFPRFAVFASAT
ncbi:MAG: hypothetical protein J2P48_00060 [Alphaproteobacteria bacterium]|nr:hypothetical protein [Alphaproteobacteria bacterium]